MINKTDISIGVVQFAVNVENNSHFLAEYPVGSISRMFAELISENLLFLNIDSSIASLIISKPEENTHKQLTYTSMLPIETVRKIFEGQFYNYLIFGEIKFENTLKVELSLINSLDEKSFRREISLKKYDFFQMSIKVINEIFNLIGLDYNTKQLNELTTYSSDNLKSWGWYSLSYENDLDNNDKLIALQKSHDNSPEFLISYIKSIIVSIQDKKYHFEELKQKLENFNTNIINYFALIEQAKKEYLIAFDLFKISYQKDANQNNILGNLVTLSEKNSDNTSLKYYLEKYIENIDNSEFDYEEITLSIYNIGQKELSIEKALKGLESNPQSAKINSILAYIYMSENDFEKAEIYYEKSFELSRSVNILEDWSSVLLKNNQNGKLIENVNRYSDDLPFNSGLHCNLAIAYININQKEKAIEVLEKAVKSDINNVRLNSLLGNIYLDKKSYARSQKYFSLAIQNDPQNYNWYVNMGNLFFEQEDFNEAEKYYLQAKKIKSDLKIPQYWVNQGYQLKKEKKYQESLNKFLQASKQLPQSFIPVYEIAQLFLENNNIDESMDILEKNAENFNNEARLWQLLNKVYLEKGNSFFGKKWKIKAEEAHNKYKQLINKE